MTTPTVSATDIKPTRWGNAVYRCAGNLLRPLYHLPMKIEIQGAEKLPQEGGFIVVSNHLTMVDPITAAYPLFRAGILPRFLAKESLFRAPLLGWLMRQCAHIPVARGSAHAGQSLLVAQQVLEAGGAVLIFPEGTLTTDPELWPMSSKTGAARLALATGAPIYPLAHWGDQNFLDQEGKVHWAWPRHRVKVVIGDRIDVSDLQTPQETTGRPSHKQLKELTNRMLDSLTSLLEEIRQEKAPSGRWNGQLKEREGL